MKNTKTRRLPAKKPLLGLVAAACVLGAGAASLSAAGAHYTEWSTPKNLGATINTTFAESGPALSKDGLSLYFYSDRPGGNGGNDIWVSQRERGADDWGTPQNLGPTINTTSSDSHPTFSRDGHWMFFTSERPGGFGGADIYQSYRTDIHDDFDWGMPTNLGANINTPSRENGGGYFENDEGGAPQLFFGSDRPGGLGGVDIYMSELGEDDSWGPATPVVELNSTANENTPNIRHDGREVFFYALNRAGGVGGLDVWVATRDTVDAPWSTPVNLGAPVDTSSSDLRPYLSADAETLFFDSNRAGSLGGADLYAATRSKSHGHE